MLSTGYIGHMNGLWFCLVCQSPLSCEEVDFDTCDACGGEGFDASDAYPEAAATAMTEEGR